MRPMYRKVISMLMTLALLLALAPAALAEGSALDLDALNQSARDTEYFTPYAHIDLNYDEIAYEHIDPAPLLAEAGALRALCADAECAAELTSRILALADGYSRIVAMYDIMENRQFADAKDEQVAAEFGRVSADRTAVEDAFFGLIRDVLNSPCAAVLDGLLSERARERFLSYRDKSDEEMALRAQETALVSEYMSRDVDRYAVAVDGKEYTSDSARRAYQNGELTYDEYWEIDDDICKKKNAALGEVFVQMVSIRNRIAELNGCGSYAEYAYKEIYGRDYTPAEAQMFCDAVKTYIAPKVNVYWMLHRTPDQSAMPEGVAYAGEGMFDTLLPRFAQLSDELLESARYILEHRAYDVDPSPNKTGTAYSNLIPYYQMPYLFINADGTWQDLVSAIHELGHNNSFYWTRTDWNDPPLIYDTAEVHSQALELLMLRFYPELFGTQADAVASDTIYDLLDAIVSGCLYDEWQRRVYETPELTLEKANQIFRQVCEAYGQVDADDERTELYDWVDVSHNFDSPMYYISYATSAAGALAFWEASQSDYFAAVDDYLRFTALGFACGFEDCFRAVGMDSPLSEHYIAGLADSIHTNLLLLKPYTDVYADDWYGESVFYVDYYALMNGVGGSLFAPDAGATREQSMTILARMDDEREDAGAPYTLDEGVAWAVENGISDGLDRTAELTREQFVTMLYRYAQRKDVPGAPGDLSGFSDAGSVSDWAADAMAWAVGTGIVGGMGDGTLAPQGSLRRAQLAAMLYRFAQADA